MTLSIKRANEMKNNISNIKDDSGNHSDDFCVKSDDGKKCTICNPIKCAKGLDRLRNQ